MNPIKSALILVITGGILVVGAVTAFSLFFYSQEVSTNINDWGAFGSYLSGAIGAPISILALVGAVIALYQQHKADKKINDQSISLELMRSIERLEEALDNTLEQLTININYPDIQINIETNALRILTEIYPHKTIDKVIPRFISDPEVVIKETEILGLSEIEKHHLLRSLEVYSGTTRKLKFMKSLLVQHKNLTGHNITAVYYKIKYKSSVSKLYNSGYPIDLWDDIDEIS